MLGSVDVPTVSAFTHAFIQQHYNPKAFIATAGPDQGAAFVKAVGAGNENGIFVPNGWFGGFQKADSQQMVKEYIAKYGGTPSDVNADVAEAYSVGQVMAQAVQATHGFDNAKIIAYLHSGVTLDSVQGPVKFDSAGREHGAEDADLPVAERHARAVDPDVDGRARRRRMYPKPAWSSELRRAHGDVVRTALLEAIVDGVLTGGVYALMAAGLTLIFGVMDIINIAQGVMVILGAYLSYELSVHLGIGLLPGPADHRPGRCSCSGWRSSSASCAACASRTEPRCRSWSPTRWRS